MPTCAAFLLRGDDLNPAQCLASAGCAGRVRFGMSDRSLKFTFICSPCGLSRLRGGGRRSWVKLRTIVGSFWGESFTCLRLSGCWGRIIEEFFELPTFPPSTTQRPIDNSLSTRDTNSSITSTTHCVSQHHPPVHTHFPPQQHPSTCNDEKYYQLQLSLSEDYC
jgi:hypothetical protein